MSQREGPFLSTDQLCARACVRGEDLPAAPPATFGQTHTRKASVSSTRGCLWLRLWRDHEQLLW